MPRVRSLIFFVFLILLGGGFLAVLVVNRNFRRPAPASAEWGMPDKAIRIASLNIGHGRVANVAVIEAIAKAKADVVLLQEVERSDLTPIAEAFGGVPPIYHASENVGGHRTSFGNAILSHYSLFDAGVIPSGEAKPFGVWGTVLVGKRKFVVASVKLSEGPSSEAERRMLEKVWGSVGRPAMVVGGNVGTSSGWTGVFGMDGELVVSSQWKVGGKGVVAAAGSTDGLLWVESER